jgi:hypothetical protein
MQKILDKYSATAILFLITAILFISIPIIFGFDEYVTAAFVISGMACTMLGCFVVMFSGNEPVDPHLIGLLPVQGSMNLCRIASDSGITGNAHFLPPNITKESRVMQFNPVSTYFGGVISAKGSFVESEPRGLITIPTSDPLIQDLRNRYALVIPDSVEELSVLINDTVCEVFEFAPRVSMIWESNRLTITLHDFRYIEGCLFAHSQYPQCCTRYPCPACSLCGSLIAECIKKSIALEQCSASSPYDITAIFSFN